MLDEDALPILDEVFELPDFSVLSRIQLHCTEKEQEFAERMQEIFEGEDDYGSAELILQYWNGSTIHYQRRMPKNMILTKQSCIR